jgi:single-strand DNA-binding protein
MKYGINRVTLVGNVGEEPKSIEKDGEILNTTFPFATSETFKDKNGEENTRTEWHRVKVWNKQASIVKQYVKKGDPLFIEGKIHTDTYEGDDGKRRYSTEIICDTFVFLQTKKSA